jgi:hypothetical protein
MDSPDDQLERLYQLLLVLKNHCENLVNTINTLEISENSEFYNTNKSPTFIIDCIKKGKIVTNDIGRA